MNKTETMILQMLAERPYGLFARDILALTGVREETIRTTLRSLHVLKKIHVADWSRGPNGGRYAALWVLGPGQDAPKPKQGVRVRQRVRQREAPYEWGTLTRHLETIWKGSCHAN